MLQKTLLHSFSFMNYPLLSKTSMKPDNPFYQSSSMTNISQKGYTQEKQWFLHEKLNQLTNTANILDVACNDGELSQQYTVYGNVTGIDINEFAVVQARQRGIECFKGDILRFPPGHEHSFDVIIATDILEHIFDTDAFILKLRELLAPQGTLLLSTPNVASLGRRCMLAIGKNPFLEFSTKIPSEEYNVGHVRYYTAQTLRQQLEFYGFRHVHMQGSRINILPWIHIPYPIARYIPSLSTDLFVQATIF